MPSGSAAPGQSRGRSAERARNVNGVARAGAIAAQGRPTRDRAAHHDIADQLRRVPEISAGERHAFAVCERQQAVVEPPRPAVIRPRGQSQGEQTETRRPAHRGDIAQAAGQRLPAAIGGAVGFAPEMHVFHQQIRGEQQILARAARAEDGAIVADAEDHAGAGGKTRPAADPLDPFRFPSHRLCVLDHTMAI